MKTHALSRIAVAALTVLCSAAVAQEAPADASTTTQEEAPKPPPQVPVLPTPPGDVPIMPPPAPTPLSSLDNIVDMAQQSSPEVLIAEAQLREAEARLRQARLVAAQQAIQATYDRKVVEEARKNVEELANRVKLGTSSHQELQAAQERLAQAEAALAKQDAALKMMTGPPPGMPDFGNDPMRLAQKPLFPAPRPALPEKPETEIEKALASPVTIEFDEANLDAILEFVSDYVSVNIVLDVGLSAADQPVSIKIQDVPLNDAFLALADICGDVCFVVRDYGIFVTTPQRAATIEAPTIPPDIPLYVPLGQAGGRGGFGWGWSADGKGGAAGGFGGGGFGAAGGFGGGSGFAPGRLPAAGGFGGGSFGGGRMVGGTVGHPGGTSEKVKVTTYRAKQGDTLDTIAQRFGVTVDQLREWNDLPSGPENEGLKVGQDLTIKQEQDTLR